MPFSVMNFTAAWKASSADVPVRGPELTIVPEAGTEAGMVAPSNGGMSSGWITTRTSIPYFRANSKSRWSCAGTAMMAPVP